MELEQQSPTPEAAPAETSAPESGDGFSLEKALNGAFDSIDWDDDGEAENRDSVEGEKLDAEAENKTPSDDDGPARGPDGRFVSKRGDGDPATGEQAEAEAATDPATSEQAKPAEPAPSGVNAEAWAKADPQLRADISRRYTELENGLSQYQQAFAPLRDFAKLAHEAGKDLPQLLGEYRNAEMAFYSDPASAIREIAALTGFDVEDVALQLLDDDAPHPAARPNPQSDPHYQQLQQQVAALQQQLQQREMAEIQSKVETFKTSAPRFEELRGDMYRLAQAGYGAAAASELDQLKELYSIAERLKPVSATSAQPAPIPQPQTTPQTPRAANKSVSGAPSGGSNPSQRRASKSAEDAMEHAFSQLGI